MTTLATAKDVGGYLKLTESTIYKLASEGILPGFRIGKSWRFDMEEVQREIDMQKGVNKKKEVKGK